MATALIPTFWKWWITLFLKRYSQSTSTRSTSQSVNDTGTTIDESSRDREYAEVFRHVDANGDNKISSEELAMYLSSLGEPLTDCEVLRAIQNFNKTGDSTLELPDFLKFVGGGEEQVEEDLRKAFNMFELNTGSGFIEPLGLQKMLGRLGDVKSLGECLQMIQAYDLDGNGKLDFQEFRKMMG